MSTDPADLVGEATAEPPGRITAAERPTDDHVRVTVATPDGPTNTDADRVTLDDDRERLLRTIGDNVSEPEHPSEHATLASEGVVGGICLSHHDWDDEQTDAALERAIAAGEVVRFDVAGRRYYCPAEEERLRAVIAEENRRDAPDVELIEAAAAAIEEVSG